MFKPELYYKSNPISRTYMLQSIDRFATKIRWKQNSSVIDLGCGDGLLTAGLKNCVYTNFSKIVGCDISEEMLLFANKFHGNEGTTFEKFDLGGKVPKDLRGSFDLAISSFALQWIRNQEKAFSNVQAVLKDGGECLLVFPLTNHVNNFYIEMSNIPKWSHYLKDFDKYISPYNDIQQPENQIATIMNGLGFTNIEVNVRDELLVRDLENFRALLESVCPFKLPLSLREDFMEDYMGVFRDKQFMHTVGGETVVKIEYRLAEVYGQKHYS